MKKTVSFVLVLSMAAALLAGCGGTTANNDAVAGTESTVNGSAATDAAGTDNTTVEGEAFRIGGIGPVTGGAAAYGIAVKNGAQLAVDEINAAGGINGVQIAFNFEDDEHDPEKAVNAYNTLKDWDMQMLMGTVTSGPCLAVSEETKNDNMFMLTPSGTAVDCVQYDNAFRVCFSDPNQGGKSAEYIGTNKIASKVAVIYDSSDVYSSGIYAEFAKKAPEYGIEIVAAEAFTSDNKTDFTIQLQKAKDGGAELVFLPIYYQEAALILSQANSMGFAPMFFGCDGLDGILAVEDFDVALAEGVMLLTPFVADENEATKAFVNNYEAAYGETPIQFAANAYDAIYIIKAALEQAGATPDMDASELCELIKTAMTEITVSGLTGEMTWTADGEVNKEPKAVKIADGVYTAM
ncbi:MAG: ABC transporter substrate-binding protein [Lachnospiraceae bacterium]|nr:ABC transporter substrate-binding protein [Lachnospiraceae bacterium]